MLAFRLSRCVAVICSFNNNKSLYIHRLEMLHLTSVTMVKDSVTKLIIRLVNENETLEVRLSK